MSQQQASVPFVKNRMIISVPDKIVAKCEVRSYTRECRDTVWYYLEFS